MTIPIVQTQYDSLEEIAKRFDDQADHSEKMARHLIQMLDQLEGGGWEGDSAQAFFREMNDGVIPTTNNLRDAFTAAGETTRQIIQVVQTAEQEAANQFQITNEGGQSNGRVVEVPASYNDGGQPPDGQEGEKKSWWGKYGEWVHGGLDVIGLAPGLGEIADGINGLIYTAEGRPLEASLSYGAMIPFAGWGATAGKVGVRVGREVAEEGAERIVREGVEEGAERVVREGADDAAGGITRIADDPPATITVKNGHKSVKDPTFLKTGELASNTSYSRNGYDYVTDANGRVSEISGTLRLEEYPRYRDYETKVGNIYSNAADDGGHLIGNRFGGVSEGVNLVPQNGNLNKGAWKTMENEWANALGAVPPKNVEVNIKTIYSNDGVRPDSFVVKYKIDGKPYTRTFKNQAGG